MVPKKGLKVPFPGNFTQFLKPVDAEGVEEKAGDRDNSVAGWEYVLGTGR